MISIAAMWIAAGLPWCAVFTSYCRAKAVEIIKIDLKDPRREAKESAARGDFRLRAFGSIWPGLPTIAPGLKCTGIRRTDIGRFYTASDYVQYGDKEYGRAVWRYFMKYNSAAVADPLSPYKHRCAAAP